MSEIDGITSDVCPSGTVRAEDAIFNYLDLSTGHLPKNEADALLTHDWLVVTTHEWGWWVWIRPANDMNTIQDDLPALANVMAFAKERGCRWINFDSDAAAVEGLPYWEWRIKMTDKDLTPGVYRLTEDVPNPERDRRRTRDAWHEENFKKGTWFIYTERHEKIGPDEDVSFVSKRLSIFGEYNDISPHSERWDPIVAKLERVPESIRSWMAFTWSSPSSQIPARDLFEKLGAMGRLTLKDIQEAYAEVERDWNEEWEREQALRKAGAK